jgi:short-subunit dehydrogenase
MAAYAASKAFLLALGEALWAEARSAGVRVVTVCPDPVSTSFHDRAWEAGEGLGLKREPRPRQLRPEEVVEAALAAVEADRPRAVVRVPFWRALSAVTSAVGLVVPRRWEVLAIERISRGWRETG